ITDHKQYDPATGNVTSQTDGAGAQTLYQYDARGNLARASRYVPNDATHPCCTMLANWNYTYDTNFPDKVTAITPMTAEGNPMPNYAAWTYEYNGPTETAPSALKNVRRYNTTRTNTETIASYVHDAKGHTLSVIDRVGHTTS